ncbi:hypothetical protein BJY24_007835 [Nocardia transvalensis]|uniref:Uncharacterized protein n=1 Tax=Nocardia transvalensis TaxID=37333 RepID=A0A7W9PNS3_9NOCA|nr:hypothetical protein [Nocardia transvalensis]MBB5918923.1 hypothetical protein [Nocardia transvalensis]
MTRPQPDDPRPGLYGDPGGEYLGDDPAARRAAIEQLIESITDNSTVVVLTARGDGGVDIAASTFEVGDLALHAGALAQLAQSWRDLAARRRWYDGGPPSPPGVAGG